MLHEPAAVTMISTTKRKRFSAYSHEVAPLFAKTGDQLDLLTEFIENPDIRDYIEILLSEDGSQIIDVRVKEGYDEHKKLRK